MDYLKGLVDLILTKACFHSKVGWFAIGGELLKQPGVDTQSCRGVCGLPQKTRGQTIIQGGEALVLDNPGDHTKCAWLCGST